MHEAQVQAVIEAARVIARTWPPDTLRLPIGERGMIDRLRDALAALDARLKVR